MVKKFEFQPIGVVHSDCRYRYEAPRQGVFASGEGEIEIFSEFAGDAIADLAGFERIWVIFCFHLNCGKEWKAKVRPPLPVGGPCRSVFATRSPHRVNPIGLSCVELTGISGRKLLIRSMDIFDVAFCRGKKYLFYIHGFESIRKLPEISFLLGGAVELPPKGYNQISLIQSP